MFVLSLSVLCTPKYKQNIYIQNKGKRAQGTQTMV